LVCHGLNSGIKVKSVYENVILKDDNIDFPCLIILSHDENRTNLKTDIVTVADAKYNTKYGTQYEY
jgi:hypothetical protein